MSKVQTHTIAIDGPSASGKSTVSRKVARLLDYIYVDSGSLYRGMTWKVIHDGVEASDAQAVIELMEGMDMQFFVEEHAVRFTIDGEDPGDQIRSEPVRENVSDVAAIPEVRAFMVQKLRDMADFGNIVMEGRDIGSVVFPQSPYKFYLDADPEERAKRRHAELVERRENGNVNEVLNSLKRRDEKDTKRATAPLQIPLGAQVINTTRMTIDEVVATIAECVQTTVGTNG